MGLNERWLRDWWWGFCLITCGAFVVTLIIMAIVKTMGWG